VVIDRLQHDRIGRRNGVELVARKAARLVGELLFRPAAENHDPLARRGAAHPIGQHLHRLLARGDAIEAQLVMLGRPDPMGVIVDQAGNDGAPVEIDDLGRRAFKLVDGGVVADRHDALAANGKRLRDREAIIDRDDLAVDENLLRRLRAGGGGPSGQHGENQQVKGAHGVSRNGSCFHP
jgi:hypothetical protein